ncbi:hypothetical protein C4S77_04660 [Apibacter adventoris]|uniref:Uncharacterized protein n=1 Tax=Apibacter adventoris TaxID=1679466 RepID=A0A2S8AEJ9_9FLAO|nr:hypothetical protein C4S77_04660 [Apibacter adventoris]
MTKVVYYQHLRVTAPYLAKQHRSTALFVFAKFQQEGTGLRPVLPLALRGKAFGFSMLLKHAVITPAIIRIDKQFYLSRLNIRITIK